MKDLVPLTKADLEVESSQYYDNLKDPFVVMKANWEVEYSWGFYNYSNFQDFEFTRLIYEWNTLQSVNLCNIEFH